jgi:hypothetical protein
MKGVWKRCLNCSSRRRNRKKKEVQAYVADEILKKTNSPTYYEFCKAIKAF